MAKAKQEKPLCVNDLRHAEYYGMQESFDDLYARSRNGERFTALMDLILKRENILLAYRNIKANHGSGTPGTDNVTIGDIGKIPAGEVVRRVQFIVAGSKHGYRPKPVRRKDIPKPNGSTRPLGIPCAWDRLIQQCIKQVMEPICEAQFSKNSFGFRPQRSVEDAIAATYVRLQRSKLHYVIEFDIKGFFDNVDHPKLLRQIWQLGIQDKHLLYVLRQILKAPIKMPDGGIVLPEKGTPQGGIISPLLANIVLNELDHWIDSQWLEHPVLSEYKLPVNKNGNTICSNGYAAMRKTALKEMYIVRYADDFRIFCRTKTDALKTKIAITQWLKERLKLDVSEEKTRIVNVKRRYSEFLGFKIKVVPKSGKLVVGSHISDKAWKRQRENLIEQAKHIAKATPHHTELDEIKRYNAMVMGVQNYYRIATAVSLDCKALHHAVMTVLANRLRGHNGRLVRKGRKLTEFERKRYGRSAMLRYVAGSDEPVYPIGFIQHKAPKSTKNTVNAYTPEGRAEIHKNLEINVSLMIALMKEPLFGRSTELADNRISMFSAQWGKCAVTGKDFLNLRDIHCHHKIPKYLGGTDQYANLILILEPVHKLIHAKKPETIQRFMAMLELDAPQLAKVNALRKMLKNAEIHINQQ